MESIVILIAQFRVKELQECLSNLRYSKVGRKDELRGRLGEILKRAYAEDASSYSRIGMPLVPHSSASRKELG